MSMVAKMVSVTVGTLTIAINSLVKKGYVNRMRGERDSTPAQHCANTLILVSGTIAFNKRALEITQISVHKPIISISSKELCSTNLANSILPNVFFSIDMQNDFVTGALGTKEAEAIVDKVEEKIAAMRKRSLELLEKCIESMVKENGKAV